ncbi:putative ABC transporter permease subunit [Paraclostridium sordellii]|uniref:putative ABC transporter permease subunit n=1 Tax=Paraclostridium sordellii TaxID=1505 RepID=UPI001F069BEB|nr:ABC transporter permease [Paeniclostridium sordellii]MCH1965496.1 ABC transporter permease [Paeniclostridium sordellii]
MSNLGLLLKISFLNTIGINKLRESSKGENIKKISIGILILFSIIVLMGSMFSLMLDLADMLKKVNQMELLLVIGFLGAVIFNLVNSIYKAPSYLYQARDYEMLSSLPIKDSTIFASKIILLVSSNYLYSAFIMMIPSLVYFIKGNYSFIYIINLLIMFITTPFIPIIISSIITYLIGRLSYNSRYKNSILIIGSILATLVIILISYNMDNFLEVIIKNSSSIIEISKKIYVPAYYFIDGLKNNNLLSVLIFSFLSITPFITFILIFSKGFRKINSKMTEGYKVNDYKVKGLKSSKPIKALLNKEIKRYFSSYIYVLNTSFGLVLLGVLAVGIIILGKDKIATIINLSSYTSMFNVQITMIIMFCIFMSCTTSSSISLEGKNLWILKSLPIDELDIFKSKLGINILLVLPIALISFLLISIKLKFSIFYIIIMSILIIVSSFFIALYGLFINLLYPKLDYINEVEVVKRGLSSTISIFSSLAYLGIYGAIYYFLKLDFNVLLILAITITLAMDLILWKIIKTKGVNLFRNLG